jgi:hypothetical protein
MSKIEAWAPGAYSHGDYVLHNGEVYVKVDDDDQSEPDNIAGGWELVPNTNVVEYNAIVEAFESYEAKKAAHRRKVHDVLAAAGITDGDALRTLEEAEDEGYVQG